MRGDGAQCPQSGESKKDRYQKSKGINTDARVSLTRQYHFVVWFRFVSFSFTTLFVLLSFDLSNRRIITSRYSLLFVPCSCFLYPSTDSILYSILYSLSATNQLCTFVNDNKLVDLSIRVGQTSLINDFIFYRIRKQPG